MIAPRPIMLSITAAQPARVRRADAARRASWHVPHDRTVTSLPGPSGMPSPEGTSITGAGAGAGAWRADVTTADASHSATRAPVISHRTDIAHTSVATSPFVCLRATRRF